MSISTNDLKNGMALDLPEGLMQVVEFQHVKPGKGGAFVRTKLRNVRTGSVLEKTFNAGIRVEQAIVDRQDMQFLYRDGDDYVFMNTSTYDQLHVDPAKLGDAAGYLVEQAVAQIAQHDGDIIGVESVDLLAPNADVQVLLVRDRPFRVELPIVVELQVARTDPGVKGDTVSNVTKPAELETGATVNVPLFVNEGDRLRVDTRTREYVSRA